MYSIFCIQYGKSPQFGWNLEQIIVSFFLLFISVMIKIPYIEQEWQRYIYVKPLHPNIIMHILDTVPYTFYGIDNENFV